MMLSTKGSIHKISRPALPDVFERKRLIRLLKEGGARPVTWVKGPAGSGKTTLVAAFLVNHNSRCLWYQVDQRDEDPAAFFYYLCKAVRQASPRKRKPIPLLTREHFLSLNAFALNFFESAYERLGPSATLVIDNYHLIPPGSLLHQLISHGLTIIPDGIRMIIISREAPSPAYSRMQANRCMDLLGWPQLQLTLEETAGIAQLHARRRLSDDTVLDLHRVAQGWVAGLTMMLAQVAQQPTGWSSLQALSPQQFADYFSNEVFERETARNRDFLLKAALLPHLTPETAAAMTGRRRAEVILQKLYQDHRFTEKRISAKPCYQFHPLFREFLLGRAEQTFTRKELAGLRRRAALLIEREGDIEEAATLFTAAEDWGALSQLVKTHARDMFRQGRYITLLAWLGRLPGALLSADPWLGYWMGAATLPYDPAGSRGFLEKAFEGFRGRNDCEGIYLAWSDIVGSIYYGMSDYTALDHWIGVLRQLQAEQPEFPSAMVEGRVVAAMFIALNSRQLDHPDIAVWADRASALLCSPLDINLKAFLLNQIILHRLYTGDLDKAAEAMASLGPATTPANPALPLITLISAIVKSNYYLLVGLNAACVETVANGLEAFRQAGVQFLDILLEGYGAWSALTHGDYPAVRKLLESKADLYRSARPFDQRLYLIISALEALSREDLRQAEIHAQAVLKICEDLGAQFNFMIACLVNALVMHANARHDAADRFITQALELARAAKSRQILFYVFMLQARFALDRGRRAESLDLLREGLALGRAMGIYNHVVETRPNVARLFATALEEDIEAPYAREFIRRLRLMPARPPLHIEGWPWPIKIYSLGRFRLVIDDMEKHFPGRTQSKPMALLQVLIALGARNVPESSVTDHLWPDADGDLAHISFNTTLHRLRKILGHDQALELKAGRLTLEEHCCWVDSRAFEHCVKLSREARRQRDHENALRWADKALDSYKGPFLGGVLQVPWALAYQEKLKTLFLTTIEQAADLHSQKGDHASAAALYRRGLEIDALVEPFYQGLMRCLKQLDRRAEAAQVYQRCRRTLSSLMGIAPSRLTEEIFRSL